MTEQIASEELCLRKIRRTYQCRLYRSKHNNHLHQAIDIAGNMRNHIIALQKRYYRIFGKHIPSGQMQPHISKLRMGKQRAHKPAGRKAKNYGKLFTCWQAIPAQSAQDMVMRVEQSYQNFFDNLKKGKSCKVGLPRFKKSKKYSSFTMKTNSWKLLDNCIGSRTGRPIDKNIRRTGRIRIMGRVYKFVWTRPIRGSIQTVTVKRDNVGDLWLFFSVIEIIELPKKVSTGESGGFDFGLKYFLTNHEGQVIISPQFYREGMKQIQRLSRSHSRKVKGSNNRERSRLALARAHRDIANKRDNHQWHLAHDLCKRYDVLVFETLNISAMQQMWGRKISDLGFADFLEKLKHVANKLDKTVIQINRWEATSKTCSGCGEKKEKLSLKERIFECANCGLVLDRDHNAARNIYQVGTSTCRREVVRRDESDGSSRSFV
ncbi:MAG: RNA-guided endonuclease InsQ/TnpB family protein [Aggregatilineales bacterium]